MSPVGVRWSPAGREIGASIVMQGRDPWGMGSHGRGPRKVDQLADVPPASDTATQLGDLNVARDQGELPGVRPAHIKRLEEISDAINKNKEKISALKDSNLKLEAEAIQLWDEHELTDPLLRGEDEWAVATGPRKFRAKRHKITKEKAEQEQRRKATA